MDSIYLVCLVLGLLLLIIDLLSSGITDLFSSAFFTDFSGDGLSGVFPFSFLELLGFMIGFGGMGFTCVQFMNLHLIPAILCGLLLSFGIRYLLKTLRRVESNALTIEDLLGTEGTVITTILEGSVGSVTFDTSIGKITYPAKSDKTILQGCKIRVIAIDKYTMIVTDELNFD